ncbi:sphingolipid delta(4)-desaturase DES1-like [Brevipalpus obovatus]|uniref:sphingolipid delta(4)-desaturase DES1-like n=1 Tax=Brevipalpus obovatus TaxID=246614 RepID=UPI003D9EFCE2
MRNQHESDPSILGDPHTIRRQLILSKHPEIKNLMVVDPHFKWQVISLVLAQIVTIIFLRDIKNWLILLPIGYFVTGIVSHALFVAIHEIVHSHAFGPGRLRANIVLGMLANLPLIFPVIVFQKQHHFKHHRFTGKYGLDPEAPSDYEKAVFRTYLGKIAWIIIGPFFTAFNYPPPESKNDEKLKNYAFCNALAQLIFSSLVAYYCGIRMILHLIVSFFMVMNLHPIAGERLSDHSFLFKTEDSEIFRTKKNEIHEGLPALSTFSYYGPLNMVAFNSGYHVEHHDFPSIPGSKLPLVRKIAPEFYNHLPHYTSRTRAILNFITEPSFGPWSLFTKADTNDQ